MLILVVNVGLKNSRCVAMTFSGEVLAQESVPVSTMLSDYFVEQDPAEWIQNINVVVKKVVSCLGTMAKEIRYLTVTTSAACLVAIDKNNNSLCNSILVSDTRSRKECALIENLAEFKSIREKGHKVSTDLMIPKILWLKKNNPEVFNQAYKFLNVGDYLANYFTDTYSTDVYNATKFYYDIESKSYPAKLLESLGINVKQLPDVSNPGDTLGAIRPKIAAKFGIPATTEIVLSTYDALAAVAGNGAFTEGDGVDISGTVTSLRVVSRNHVLDPKSRFYITPHLDNNHWLIGGSNNLGGGLIEWLKTLHYSDIPDPYSVMEKEASTVKPGCGGLLFLPYLLGERLPIWNADARGVMFGLNRSHDRAAITRAVFEGVAFSVSHMSAIIKEFDIDLKQLTVAGGLSQISLINQIKADVLGVPVIKFRNFETTAIGAALIVLSAKGVFSSIKGAFESFCTVEKVFEPNIKNKSIYEDFLGLYISTYESLIPMFKKRREVLEKHKNNFCMEIAMKENL